MHITDSKINKKENNIVFIFPFPHFKALDKIILLVFMHL